MISELREIENSISLINAKNIFFALLVLLLIISLYTKQEIFVFILGVALYLYSKSIRFQKASLALSLYVILQKTCLDDEVVYRDTFLNEKAMDKPFQFLPSLFIRGLEISYPATKLLELLEDLKRNEISSEIDIARNTYYNAFMNDGSIFGDNRHMFEFLLLIIWVLIFYKIM